MNKFYLTTPIYYPNARPHVGSAYTTIACDAIARYKRMCGYDVAFLTGTDEHGEKLQRAADAAGVPVERFVAEKRELFKNLWRTLGIPEHSEAHPEGYRFVHTSQNPAHVKAVHWMIRQATRAGYIEKKKYEGRYCVFDERYVSDNPEPVICDICGRPAELISEENYFFKLSAFQDRVLKLYEEHPEFVRPDFRMNEVKSFVKSGLRDISISRRRLKWGIPWPGDSEQVVYVWYDALTSYLSGIGFEGDTRSRDFEKYWMGADGPSEVVHMIGKDILRFHAVYWPAFLMAANDALPDAEQLPLPKTIFAHGWIYYEQDKMSKSKGNVVYPEPIVKLLGNDALRYYLLRDTPFGLDGSFSYEGLIQRYNSDLANDLGNLASRTITMLDQYFNGIIPGVGDLALTGKEKELRDEFLGVPMPDDSGLPPPLAADFPGTLESCTRAYEAYDFSNALAIIWHLIYKLNSYLVIKQPWRLAKLTGPSEKGQLRLTLYTAADLLRSIAVLAYPVLPLSSDVLWRQLVGQSRIEDYRFKDLKWQDLEPGTKVGKPEPIFPRLDKEATLRRLHELAEEDRVAEQISKEGKMESQPEQKPVPEAATVASVEYPTAASPKPEAPKITIDDFAKIELRAGTILSAEPIAGATKLLKLQVDIGTEVRQVCAGIAEYYKPEDLVGMKIVLVANLQPRKLRGVESNGMIVAASVGEDGRPVLVTFKEEVPNGAKLK